MRPWAGGRFLLIHWPSPWPQFLPSMPSYPEPSFSPHLLKLSPPSPQRLGKFLFVPLRLVSTCRILLWLSWQLRRPELATSLRTPVLLSSLWPLFQPVFSTLPKLPVSSKLPPSRRILRCTLFASLYWERGMSGWFEVRRLSLLRRVSTTFATVSL